MTLKIKKPAILLEGGPRDGWAYFEDEMPEIVRLNAWAKDYRRTERFKVHPRTGGKVQSRVWEYAPAPPPERDPWDFT